VTRIFSLFGDNRNVNTKTYQNVSPQKAEQLLDMARQHGAQVTGSLQSGGAELSDFGVRIRAQYNANAQTLTLTVESKPFFVSTDTVFSESEKNSSLVT
jgi:hypothetical protein